MANKLRFLWVLGLILLPLYGVGQTFPTPKGFVNDYKNVLSDQQAGEINEYLHQFAKTTSNEISVLIIDLPADYSVETYTNELARKWGVGGQKKSNGVVFAIYPNARKVRIEVGYGLEGAIPDIVCNEIIQQITVPSLKKNDYYGAVKGSVEILAQAAKGEYNSPSNRDYYTKEVSDPIIPLVIMMVFLFLFIYISYKSKRRGRGGGYYDGGTYWGPTYYDNTPRGGGGWFDGDGGGGGFGGFGGGDFGGGGASGDW